MPSPTPPPEDAPNEALGAWLRERLRLADALAKLTEMGAEVHWSRHTGLYSASTWQPSELGIHSSEHLTPADAIQSLHAMWLEAGSPPPTRISAEDSEQNRRALIAQNEVLDRARALGQLQEFVL